MRYAIFLTLFAKPHLSSDPSISWTQRPWRSIHQPE